MIPTYIKKCEDGSRQAIDMVSELANNRVLLLQEAVTSESVASLVASMLVLEQQDPNAPITLLISSPGGEVHAGLGLIDVMADVSCPIHTVAYGLAASMAAVILACGDKRSAYPHAEIMMHQLLSGTGMVQQTEIDIAAAHAARLRDSLDQVLASHSRLTVEEVHKLTERDAWLQPEEALKYGFIDEILGVRLEQ